MAAEPSWSQISAYTTVRRGNRNNGKGEIENTG